MASAVRREAGRGDGRGGHRRRQGEPAALDAVGRRLVRAAEALPSDGGHAEQRRRRRLAGRPLDDAHLSRAFECAGQPPPGLNPEALPCRTISAFRAVDDYGRPQPLFDVLRRCAEPDAPRVHLRGLDSLELLGAALLTKADGQGGAADEAAHGGGGSGVWVRTGAIVGGNIDYAVQPAAMWVRTHGAIYQLLRPAAEYAPHYRCRGRRGLPPLPEAQLRPLIELLARRDKHPFGGNKAAALPSLRLMNFEVCDPKAAPRSLVRTLPDGTLKAAQSAAGGADKGGDALHIYVRGQLLPAREGAARPWVWAGRCAPGRPTTSER